MEDVSDLLESDRATLMASSVELPLSIIVGCLPTLRPLFNRSKLDRPRPYQIEDDTYVLTDRHNGIKMGNITSIHPNVSRVSSGDGHLDEQIAWDVEDRC